MGRKMGVKMSTAGVISMNVPTQSNTRFMIRRITIGLSLSATRDEATFWGMFS